MKTALTLIAGIALGISISIGGGYLWMKQIETSYQNDTYKPDWAPNFDEKIYDSTAKLAAARSEYERWIALGDVALWSVDAGFVDQAEDIANGLLRTSSQYKDDWNYGNAIHKAHLTLGRVALRQNDIPTAIEHLHSAGKTPGSPQLNTFGPNMSLAFELLKVGEKDAVLEYFDLCEVYWEMGHDRLAAWRETVQSNDIPRFGANLRY